MLAGDVILTNSQNITPKFAVLGALKKMTPERAEEVAKDFESLFVSQMVEHMFGDSVGDEAFGSSDTDEVYKGLMVQEYGKMIVSAGGIGIASNIKQELLKQQEI